MDPEQAACLTDVAQLLGEAEQAPPEAIQDVIIDHGAVFYPTISLWALGGTRGLFTLAAAAGNEVERGGWC